MLDALMSFSKQAGLRSVFRSHSAPLERSIQTGTTSHQINQFLTTRVNFQLSFLNSYRLPPPLDPSLWLGPSQINLPLWAKTQTSNSSQRIDKCTESGKHVRNNPQRTKSGAKSTPVSEAICIAQWPFSSVC